MESFRIACGAVFPMLMYMALGVFVRATGVADQAFLRRLTAVVFKVFFPFLMVKNIYWSGTAQGGGSAFAVYAVVSVLALLALCMLLVPRFIRENPKRGVVVQAIYRSNLTLFTIPLAQSVYGSDADMLVTVLIALIIPIYNISAIVVLEYFRGGAASPRALIKKVATNPLILGILAGALLRVLNVPIPAMVEKPVRTLADMTTPLALFALGGTLQFASMKRNRRILAPVFALRMVLIPALSYGITMLLPFSPMERFMLLMLFATPIATSSYPMAQNMGGDGELAGELVAVTNTGSIITLFLFVFALSRMGLL